MSKENILNIKVNNRIIEYTKKYEKKIPRDFHIFIKINGYNFSKYTKEFKKPFDFILSEVMRKTTIDVLNKFGGITGYIENGDITILIPALNKRKEGAKNLYNWNIIKIASLISSYTAIKFNKYLKEMLKYNENNNNKEYIKKIRKKIGKAYFNTKIFGVPTKNEVLNTFLFITKNAEEKSKKNFAKYFKTNKNKKIVKENWDELPKRYKYGMFIKQNKNKNNIKYYKAYYIKLYYSEKSINFIMREEE